MISWLLWTCIWKARAACRPAQTDVAFLQIPPLLRREGRRPHATSGYYAAHAIQSVPIHFSTSPKAETVSGRRRPATVRAARALTVCPAD